MKKKTWLVLGSVILSVLTIFTFVSLFQSNYYIDHDGVSLSEKQYNSIQETFPNQEVKVCDIKNKDCIILKPIK